MFPREALITMNANALAELCGKVTGSDFEPALDDRLKEAGLALLLEWQQLLNPVFLTPQQAQLLQTRGSTIRQRMIEFLSSI